MKQAPILFYLLFLVQANHIFAGEDIAQAGRVRFINDASSYFDRYTHDPTSNQQQWMRRNYTAMLTYSPYFDTKLRWYKPALVYINSYAIYEDSALAKTHPEWIMRDARGNKLFIPWECGGGRCSQYAGDFSNPVFRRYMANKIKATVRKGYRGVWLDDVNLTWRVSDGEGRDVIPYDKNTRAPMTLQNWRTYFAKYLQEIRAALPKNEIAHNAIWYADDPRTVNPTISKQIMASDYINLERGGNDDGLVKGNGRWGFESFLRYIGYVHRLGKNIILMDVGTNTVQREYGLATWLLFSNGKDLFNSNQANWTTPDRWWRGYNVNLGKALTRYYKWHNLFRRDFACGSVFLNQPEMPTISRVVGNGYKNLGGKVVGKVKLPAKSAAILTKACRG